MKSDYIYYNALITDNRTDDFGSSSNPVARFAENRDVPIINDSSKYEMAIIRFSMNGIGRNLPIWIPIIETGQANINKNIYKVTLRLVKTGGGTGTYESTEPLIHHPQILDTRTPSQPTINQDIPSKCYYVYTVGHFIKMFNDAINTCYSNINAGVIIAGGTITTKAPKIKYNIESGKFELYFDNFGFGGADSNNC